MVNLYNKKNKRFKTYRKRNLKKSKLRKRKKTLKRKKSRKKSRKKQYIGGGGGVDGKMRQTDLITSNPFSAFGQSFRFIPKKWSDILPGFGGNDEAMDNPEEHVVTYENIKEEDE